MYRILCDRQPARELGSGLTWFMENGKIVEQGNHQTLLAAEGAYYRLYMSQFAGADAEETPVDDSTAVHS